MTLIHRSVLALALVATLAGCSTPVGATRFPQPTSNFAPKTTYAVGSDKLWEAMLSALEKNRFTVASSDKASGTLQTDYHEGQANLIGLGIIAAQSTRYRYNLTTRPQSDGSTRLTIICKIESTIKGGGGASQWTDVSGQNSALVQKLEAWLYEEIEKELPKP